MTSPAATEKDVESAIILCLHNEVDCDDNRHNNWCRHCDRKICIQSSFCHLAKWWRRTRHWHFFSVIFLSNCEFDFLRAVDLSTCDVQILFSQNSRKESHFSLMAFMTSIKQKPWYYWYMILPSCWIATVSAGIWTRNVDVQAYTP